jgi:hypothetical protein
VEARRQWDDIQSAERKTVENSVLAKLFSENEGEINTFLHKDWESS